MSISLHLDIPCSRGGHTDRRVERVRGGGGQWAVVSARGEKRDSLVRKGRTDKAERAEESILFSLSWKLRRYYPVYVPHADAMFPFPGFPVGCGSDAGRARVVHRSDKPLPAKGRVTSKKKKKKFTSPIGRGGKRKKSKKNLQWPKRPRPACHRYTQRLNKAQPVDVSARHDSC